MFKKALLAATCIVTMTGLTAGTAMSSDRPATGAFQTAANAVEKPGMAKAADTMKKPTHQFDGMTRASEFIGEDVTNGKGEKVGSVDDLIVSQGDHVLYAVLSVGGILGIGDKLVAVRFEELEIGAKDVDGLILYDTTKEKLKAQPAFHYAMAKDEKSRERFMRSTERRVDRWKGRIDRNMEEAKDNAKDMKEGASKRIDTAWGKVKEEWQELKNASADTWDEAKKNFDAAMADLERAWDDATS